MGHAYRAVGWNGFKKRYDKMLVLSIVLYLGVFIGLGFVLHPSATAETMIIRGFGTAAFLLLHIILCIGPLARVDARFLPLLYNRRHLGVTMFFLALGHGAFSLLQFHAFGDLNPLVSLLVSGGRLDSIAWLPFQPLGAAALVILFLMAATSHDFWLNVLSAPVWKTLHMGVYLAYALLVFHVALGALQTERHPAILLVVACGVLLVLGLHVMAATREKVLDVEFHTDAKQDWIEICGVDDIEEGRARTAVVAGERVAVFKHEGEFLALSGICQHQNGPLGEGQILEGLVTCPWHGYQYAPKCGRSPAPFTEAVPIFSTRVEAGRVYVDPRPLAPGSATQIGREEIA